jgi:thioredoxin-dependent peroxiredoxin
MRELVPLLILFCSASMTFAEAPEVTLSEGDPAPAFEAMTASGKIWRSDDHFGKKFVVVYFYPADFTNGCTRQACSFRDHRTELDEADVEVVGISGDSVKNHELFTRVNALNFPLIADEHGKVAQAFGVPLREGDTINRMVDGVEQSLKRGVTASRWTFIIGKDGRIIRKNTMVDADQDCKKVLETVRRLTAAAE